MAIAIWSHTYRVVTHNTDSFTHWIFAISLIDDLVHSFDKKMAKIWMSLLFQIPTLKEDKNTPTSLHLKDSFLNPKYL